MFNRGLESVNRDAFILWWIEAQRKHELFAFRATAYGVDFFQGVIQPIGHEALNLMQFYMLVFSHFEQMRGQLPCPAALAGFQYHG
ncbi:MAG: hypothetical protein WBK91_07690 [Alphaproteobacteria bacterium]